jgi:hypothetical protein
MKEEGKNGKQKNRHGMTAPTSAVGKGFQVRALATIHV